MFKKHLNINNLIGEIERLRARVAELEAGQQANSIHPENIEKRTQEQELIAYRQIVSSSRDCMSLVGPDYVYKVVNDTHALHFGIPCERIIGRSVSDLFGRESFESHLRPRLDRCLAGETVRFEDWYNCSLLGRRYFSVTYSPDRDEKGTVTGVVINARDETGRKLAEDELRASEKRFGILAEHSDDVIWTTDIRHHFTYLSPSVERLFGYSHEEMLQMPLKEIYTPESFALVEKMIEERNRIWESGDPDDRPNRFESEQVRKDGSIVWTETVSRPILDHEGRPIGITGITRDISERKKAERAQQVLQDRLQALWDVARMTEIEHRELCLTVLEEIQRLTGSQYAFLGFIDGEGGEMNIHTLSKDAIAGCGVRDNTLHFPLPQAGLWAQAVEDRCPFFFNDYAQDHPRKKGMPEGHAPIKNFLAVPVLRQGKVAAVVTVANKKGEYNQGDAAQVEAFLSSVMLILEKRRAEEALEAGSELLSKAFSSEHVAVAIIRGRDGMHIRVNPAFLRLIGYTSEEVIGSTSAKWGFLTSQGWQALLADFRTQGELRNQEMALASKSGDERIVLLSLSPLVLHDEECFIATMLDITERKRLEQNLERQARELQDMNAALRVILDERDRGREMQKEQMIYNIKHLVIPYLDRLQAAARNPVVDQYVEIIRRNLEDSALPLARNLEVKYRGLTANEIRVASFIHQGRTSKDIADMLNISIRTVDYYRASIRRKLGIASRKINLRAALDGLAAGINSAGY